MHAGDQPAGARGDCGVPTAGGSEPLSGALHPVQRRAPGGALAQPGGTLVAAAHAGDPRYLLRMCQVSPAVLARLALSARHREPVAAGRARGRRRTARLTGRAPILFDALAAGHFQQFGLPSGYLADLQFDGHGGVGRDGALARGGAAAAAAKGVFGRQRQAPAIAHAHTLDGLLDAAEGVARADPHKVGLRRAEYVIEHHVADGAAKADADEITHFGRRPAAVTYPLHREGERSGGRVGSARNARQSGGGERGGGDADPLQQLPPGEDRGGLRVEPQTGSPSRGCRWPERMAQTPLSSAERRSDEEGHVCRTQRRQEEPVPKRRRARARVPRIARVDERGEYEGARTFYSKFNKSSNIAGSTAAELQFAVSTPPSPSGIPTLPPLTHPSPRNRVPVAPTAATVFDRADEAAAAPASAPSL
eukprot:ctg_2168.g344